MDESEQGLRLDVLLSRQTGIPSRSFAQHMITNGSVSLNGGVAKKNATVTSGATVEFTLPTPVSEAVDAEEGPLDIVYEDEHMVVVCKPAGLVVHPAPGHYSGTLVNRLLAHSPLASTGAPIRPGIVHRLDKDTSGLMIVAKTNIAYDALTKMIRNREVARCYLALAKGNFREANGVIEAPLGRLSWDRKRMGVNAARSKPAVTKFTVLRRSAEYTLLKLTLVTGRTHQIRAHLAFIGHPIAGDKTYGGSGGNLGLERQFLHAYELRFKHPISGNELRFSCPLPLDLRTCRKKIRWSD